MAQLEVQTAGSKSNRRKIHSLRIDMTPMVDLGFLLITFFVFTTTMSDPTTMKLYMPHDGDSSLVGKSKVLTVLLGSNNRVYAYEGAFEEALKENRIITSNYDESDGIGHLIRIKQDQLRQSDNKNGRDGLVFLIKPTKQSTFKNVIDALDETTINGVKRYMILNASSEEDRFFKN